MRTPKATQRRPKRTSRGPQKRSTLWRHDCWRVALRHADVVARHAIHVGIDGTRCTGVRRASATASVDKLQLPLRLTATWRRHRLQGTAVVERYKSIRSHSPTSLLRWVQERVVIGFVPPGERPGQACHRGRRTNQPGAPALAVNGRPRRYTWIRPPMADPSSPWAASLCRPPAVWVMAQPHPPGGFPALTARCYVLTIRYRGPCRCVIGKARLIVLAAVALSVR